MDLDIRLLFLAVLIGSVYTTDLNDLGSLAKVFAMLAGGGDCEFKCPANINPKKNPLHNPSSNGCGSFGIEVDVSKYPGMDHCCYVHDICYDTCNSGRDECDESFKDCLKDTCHHVAILKKFNNKQLDKCDQVADIMHSGTLGLGCTAYTEAQRNACLCNGRKLTKAEVEKLSAAAEKEL